MNELTRGKLKITPTIEIAIFQKTCISHVEFKGKTKKKKISSPNNIQMNCLTGSAIWNNAMKQKVFDLRALRAC